jgi:hypothetical protein
MEKIFIEAFLTQSRHYAEILSLLSTRKIPGKYPEF